MSDKKRLEKAAITAYAAGRTWGEFFAEHGQAVAKAAPYDRRAYHQLVDRLLALVVRGDTIGHRPIDPDEEPPWERDDRENQQQAPPSDTATSARLQLKFEAWE
ncbi:MAG: hypothetical protein NTW96_25955 [Planctomycetia bacterium]|nr:hypothetical protein [Planctomycetia bacterium]